ncbi:hypothetical protein LP416_18870 [Polaromonas sp. P2-4]|nr:hypothetical protein LP416_18870 [Polaromonas sp. P2-4]
MPINFDVSLPINQIGEFCRAVRAGAVATLARAAHAAFWPSGRRQSAPDHGRASLGEDISPEQAAHEVEQIVYALLAERGGSVSAEHGIGLHKKPYLSTSRTPAELAAMRAIKQALDPLNLLNPGKVFDLNPQDTKTKP